MFVPGCGKETVGVYPVNDSHAKDQARLDGRKNDHLAQKLLHETLRIENK
jgi:hypothetical protein